MASENIDIHVSVDGAAQAVATLERVKRATNDTADATARTKAPTTAANESFKKLTAQGAQLSGGLNNIIGSLSGLTPELSRTTGIVSRFAGGISGATAALGPWGIAIGAAAASLPLLIDYLGESTDGFDDNTAAITKSTRSLDDFVAASRRAQTEAARNARIGAGGATAEEAAGIARQRQEAAGAAGSQLRTELQRRGFSDDEISRVLAGGGAELQRFAGDAAARANRRAINDPRNIFRLGETRLLTGEQTAAEVRPLLAEFQRLQAEARSAATDASARAFNAADIARLEDSGTGSFSAAAPGRTRGGGARGAGQDPLLQEAAFARAIEADLAAEEQREIDARIAAQEALNAAREQGASVAESTNQRIFDAFQAVRAQEQEWRDNAREAATDFAASWEGGVDRVIEAYEKLGEAQSVLGEQTVSSTDLMAMSARAAGDDIADAFGSQLESAFRSSFAAMQKGEQSFGEALASMVDQTAEALAAEAVLQGLKQTALGIGTAIFNPAESAAHFAAAATWGALAVAAGGVGAAIQSGGGGGGSAGGGPSVSRAGGGSSGGSSGDSGGTIVVNINAPTDRAQLGQYLDIAQRWGQRRYEARPRG